MNGERHTLSIFSILILPTYIIPFERAKGDDDHLLQTFRIVGVTGYISEPVPKPRRRSHRHIGTLKSWLVSGHTSANNKQEAFSAYLLVQSPRRGPEGALEA